jgi:hypothetical protein
MSTLVLGAGAHARGGKETLVHGYDLREYKNVQTGLRTYKTLYEETACRDRKAFPEMAPKT